ncbi:hypothetical protein POF45_26805 [Pseudomonas sp. 681]|uniref:Uncharacterized protein n=1 Tax=Pseudomonas fungipugnans TaxID=3024217 RepID=A0ABT6QW02_9PSED|nr:hypothetical protein [Pseudomonas sp. 681]MDI2595006.1 hypothetical protein [Pseudomonas sp. 681]
MTDQDLLVFASKSAQLDFVPSKDGGVGIIGGIWHKPWNPLKDDGDALRLAVTLGLDLKLSKYLPEAFDLVPGAAPSQIDAFEKVRRAIVEAAAEIGRAMPHEKSPPDHARRTITGVTGGSPNSFSCSVACASCGRALSVTAITSEYRQIVCSDCLAKARIEPKT